VYRPVYFADASDHSKCNDKAEHEDDSAECDPQPEPFLDRGPNGVSVAVEQDRDHEKPADPRSDLKKPWKAVSARAGLTGVRIHDLRHTHASVGAGAGLGLPIIGKLLGHTQSATTQRYAHLDNDPLKKASEHIGSRLAAAMGEVKAPRANVTNISKVKRSKNRRG
jgi:hypothetical protein